MELRPLDGSGSTSQGSGSNSGGSGPGDITLYWSAPVERVNGESMSMTDVGGYEIRYRKSNDSSYRSIIITDNSIDQYFIPDLNNAADYTFEVAVFDSNGIYSDFVVAMDN